MGPVMGPLMGPVQVLVLGYDEPTFSGEALAEVRRLQDAGIVRLVDVLAVTRDAAGDLEALPLPGAGAGLGDGEVAAALLGGDPGPAAAGPTEIPAEIPAGTAAIDGDWSLADAVAPGGSAVIVLLEHRWAETLVAAIGRGGGRPLDELWLGADDRDRLAGLLAARR